jgi:uncharacterized protein YbjT (DUF2867 family)
VFEQLLRSGRKVTGLVRSEVKAADLENDVYPVFEGSKVAVADVLYPPSLQSNFAGAEAVVICTSAVPSMKKRSMAKLALMKIVGKSGRPGPGAFRWRSNLSPQEVDYKGALNIFNAAKDAGVRRIVLVGSMGGTKKDNYLNTVGDNGNILVWKRLAEMELMGSGMEFTIIHPGGLTDAPGGKRQLVLGCNDELQDTPYRTVPRADVAAMAVACIDGPEALGRSFDLTSMPESHGLGPTTDLRALVGSMGSKSCDYKINPPPSGFASSGSSTGSSASAGKEEIGYWRSWLSWESWSEWFGSMKSKPTQTQTYVYTR